MALDAFSQVVADTTTRAHCSGSGWWMGGMAIWWVIASAAVLFTLFWLFREGLGRPRSGQNALAIAAPAFADDERRRAGDHSSTEEGKTG